MPHLSRRLLLRGEHGGRDPDRHPGLRVDRDAAARQAALHRRRRWFMLGVPRDLRARRADRRDARGRAVRLAGARHVLRRRASALRADRRHGVPAVRGALLLGAARRAASRCRSGSAAGRAACMFVGLNVAFFPMHVTGLLGMPRRVLHLPAGLGLGRAEPRLDHRRVRARGRRARSCCSTSRCNFRVAAARSTRNVWDAGTLEWLPTDNYGVAQHPARRRSREPLWDQPGAGAGSGSGQHYLPRHGDRRPRDASSPARSTRGRSTC